MLVDLTIHDFAIIDELRLRFESGFNVMTGETGAGKSIVVDAVTLLLGGRALDEVVRRGRKQARVEGLFILDERRTALLRPLLEEHGLLDEEDAQSLILAREVNAGGRNLCRVNGRAVPLALLRQVAAPLVDIHGQSEHLSLMNPRRHVDLLDRFAGTVEPRATLAEEVRALRQTREEITRLTASERELALRVDRLSYIVEEIDAATLAPNEEETLERERRVLGNSEKLSQLSAEACALLSEGLDDEHPPLQTQMAQLSRALRALAALDETMDESATMGEELSTLVDDLALTLDRYRDGVEYNPVRLDEIERRLTLIFNLKRKYGASVAEILATRESAAAELEEIEGAEARLATLRDEEQKRLVRIGRLGSEISRARRAGAEEMKRLVEQELEDLRMERAAFEVSIGWEADPAGAPVEEPYELAPGERARFDSTGLDQVEFLLAPNPGEGLKPLARIASGGEASRIMLAIKTALGHADDTPTLIFDEIDTGVGGRVGQVVGRKLYALASSRQVLCITHLPQLAAFGDQHFQIQKEIRGDRTLTHVAVMDEEARVAELAQMIGGGDAAWTAAAELREQVRLLNLTEVRFP